MKRRPIIHKPDVYPLTEAANNAKAPKEVRQKLQDALGNHVVPHDDPGTMAFYALNSIFISIGNTLIEEVTRSAVETLKASLGYDSSPMLERLLIENICVAWVINDQATIAYQHNTGGGKTYKQELHAERRLTSAQRRYLRAIDALGKIRKLKLPSLQINIASVQAAINNTTNNKPSME